MVFGVVLGFGLHQSDHAGLKTDFQNFLQNFKLLIINLVCKWYKLCVTPYHNCPVSSLPVHALRNSTGTKTTDHLIS